MIVDSTSAVRGKRAFEYNPQATEFSAHQPSPKATSQQTSLPSSRAGRHGRTLDNPALYAIEPDMMGGLYYSMPGPHPHHGSYDWPLPMQYHRGPIMGYREEDRYMGRQDLHSESDYTNLSGRDGPFGWQVPQAAQHEYQGDADQAPRCILSTEESVCGVRGHQTATGDLALAPGLHSAGALARPASAQTPPLHAKEEVASPAQVCAAAASAPPQTSADYSIIPCKPLWPELSGSKDGTQPVKAEAVEANDANDAGNAQPDDRRSTMNHAGGCRRSPQTSTVSATSPTRPHAVQADQRDDAPPRSSPSESGQLDHGRRKLYIPCLPYGTGYGDVLKLLKGGLIDDIYISTTPHPLGINEARVPSYADVTFYSEEGALNCIAYLRHVDSLNPPAMATEPSSHQFPPVAFITISGQRTPVFSRDGDQRPRLTHITDAVEGHQATRVLALTFGGGARLEGALGDSTVWQTWQDGLSQNGGVEALAAIRRHVELCGTFQNVDIESVELMQGLAPSQMPSASDSAGGTMFTVRVSLLRISDAQKVKGVLEHHPGYKEHCLVNYAPDPCAAVPVARKPGIAKSGLQSAAAQSQTFLVADESQFPPLPPPTTLVRGRHRGRRHR